MRVEDKLEMIWKWAGLNFRKCSVNCLRGTEENTKNHGRVTSCTDRGSSKFPSGFYSGGGAPPE